MNAAGRECEVNGAPRAHTGTAHVRPALVNFDLEPALYQFEAQQRTVEAGPDELDCLGLMGHEKVNSALFRQQRASFPKLGKKLFVERKFQIRRSGASTSAHAYPDDALHKLNVAQTPADDQLVKLREAFADVNPVAIAVLIAVKSQHGASAGSEL